MIKEKIIAGLVAGTISMGGVFYTYETFRFDNISDIYNNLDTIIEKYENLKENRGELLSKYNELYNDSNIKIKDLEKSLGEKEKYIKELEAELNSKIEGNNESDKCTNKENIRVINEENNIEKIDKDVENN